MTELIITHPGKAHFDEFLAISLILAVHRDTDFIIKRRSPTPDELENPNVWVVDIGERYEKELRNFDHHQDLNLSVSFVMVADYLKVKQTLETAPWWSFKDRMDRFGPINTAREMGIESLLPAASPLEEWLIDEFEKAPQETSPLMARFGRDLIAKAETIHSRMNFWEKCDTQKVKDKTVLIALTSETIGLREYSESLDQPVDVSVTFDNRGEGWRLRRINDGCRVNFSRLEYHKEISFAHKGGFIAKTRKKLPLQRIFELIAEAIE